MRDVPNLFPDLEDSHDPHALKFSTLRTPVWTENKAKLIAKYLFYFVMITKHGAYIDGFAAPKEPELASSWAAKLVIESTPKFLREFFLCEMNADKATALRRLVSAQPIKPRRHFEVYVEDFNVAIDQILSSGKIKNKTAAFCLIDQYTFECHWKTVQSLASHKKENKIELFYFLASGWLDRGLSGFTKNLEIPELWWGRDDWRELKKMNQWDRARLFCERFETELGYKHVRPWPIYDKGIKGRVMFHMIHASDHDAAPKLMYRAYKNATKADEPIEWLQQSFLDNDLI